MMGFRTRNTAQKPPKLRPVPVYVVALTFAITYMLSTLVLSFYDQGDRLFYTRLYSALANAIYPEVAELQSAYTGSSEPLYGLLMWLSAHVMSNDVCISIANSVLASCLMIFLYRNEANVYAYGLTFTNYYFFVLVTSAERLKFGVLFALLALALQSPRLRTAAAIAAPLCHFQIFILYAAITPLAFSGQIGNKFSKKILRNFGLRCVAYACAVLLACLFLYNFRDNVADKISVYTAQQGVPYVLIALSIFSLITWPNNPVPVLQMLFLVFVAFGVGDERINIFGYLLYSYNSISSRRVGLFYYVISLYLSYKSIAFIQNVITFGNGFV